MAALVPADATSPSQAAGMAPEDEARYRRWACELAQCAGIMLKRPQVVMVSAQHFVHRFYFRRSLTDFEPFMVSMGCLFVAGKVEERPKRAKDVLNVYHHLARARQGKPQSAMALGGAQYQQWERTLFTVERHLLKELGFCLYRALDHPHRFVLYFVRLLNGGAELAQRAWNQLNDVMRLALCVQHRPEAICCAAIYVAARQLGVRLPLKWWTRLGTDDEELAGVCEKMLALHALPAVGWLPPPPQSAASDAYRFDSSEHRDPSLGALPLSPPPPAAPAPARRSVSRERRPVHESRDRSRSPPRRRRSRSRSRSRSPRHQHRRDGERRRSRFDER